MLDARMFGPRLLAKFTASPWRAALESVFNLSGWTLAVMSWWVGASTWQTAIVTLLSAAATSLLVYVHARQVWKDSVAEWVSERDALQCEIAQLRSEKPIKFEHRYMALVPDPSPIGHPLNALFLFLGGISLTNPDERSASIELWLTLSDPGGYLTVPSSQSELKTAIVEGLPIEMRARLSDRMSDTINLSPRSSISSRGYAVFRLESQWLDVLGTAGQTDQLFVTCVDKLTGTRLNFGLPGVAAKLGDLVQAYESFK